MLLLFYNNILSLTHSSTNQVFDITCLQIFTPSELDYLLCGRRELWEVLGFFNPIILLIEDVFWNYWSCHSFGGEFTLEL